jgi:hypothetical protein
LTPEAELARLRRREKKILYNQIRERKRAKGLSRPTAGDNLRPRQSKPTFLIQIYIRQKWQEVPYTEGTTWGKFRKYLRRKFKLKQWQWSFEEQEEGIYCVRKLENPFVIERGKKFRIVLKGPSVRFHPGKGSGAAPYMNKAQRRRIRREHKSVVVRTPKEEGGPSQFTWSPDPPEDEDLIPLVPMGEDPTQREPPKPTPRAAPPPPPPQLKPASRPETAAAVVTKPQPTPKTAQPAAPPQTKTRPGPVWESREPPPSTPRQPAQPRPPPAPKVKFARKKECKEAVWEKLANNDFGGAEELIEQYEKDSGVQLSEWLARLRRAKKISAKAAWRKVEKGRKRK